MNKNLFLSQIKQLIKPAYGCTEIGTVALSVAKASSLIENKIKKINVVISDYIYRNLVNVGVPKLGFCGIDFIVASAAILKNPEDKLNILIKLNSSRKKEAEVLLNKKNITLTHTSNVNPIYCKTEITDLKNNKATVIIEYEHDTFSLVKLNNKVISSYKNKSTDKQTNNMFSKLSLEDIIKNVKSLQLKDLTFLNEGIDMNNEIANYGLKHYSKSNYTKSIKNNNLINKAYEPILITLTAGIEARMNGCELPVMSSCGSGDHGLTISIPLFSFAKKNKIAKLSFYQSLALAHLITWKIKSNIGDLCAFCGSVVAAVVGSITGIAYMLKFSSQQTNDLINANLCSFSCSVCDGAKPSCALKIIDAFITGLFNLNMVKNKMKVKHLDGIVNKNCFDTIKQLGNISNNISKNFSEQILSCLWHNNKK